MRIALVFGGLAPPERAFSGVPWGLGNGLRSIGHEPIFVRSAAPVPLERATRYAARRLSSRATLEPELAHVRTAGTAARLRAARPVDAVIQLSTGVLVPTHHCHATFEDMTVVQAVASDEAYRAMSTRARRAWVARQAESYRRAAVCLTASRWAARSIVEDYGVPADKVSVVGLGRHVDPQPKPRDWWPPRFLFVGLDWRRKNGEAVVSAFRRLRETVPDATLDVVGRHPVLELDGVRGHGVLSKDDPAQLDRLTALFESSTCFVMPSFAEPLGMAYAEAAAAGIPAIGSTRGGSSEAVGDGGASIDPSDGEALFEAMRRYVDPALARSVGARAAATRESTTWSAVASRAVTALRAKAIRGR